MKRRGRPKGSRDGAGAAQARPFVARYVDAWWHVSVPAGTRQRHFHARETAFMVPTLARPDGSVVGDGVVRLHDSVIAITA